jgi:hypothetical protein
MDMAFTFWQRFYPKLIWAAIGWGGLGFSYSNATDPSLKPGLIFFAWALGFCLVAAGVFDAIKQAQFRIHVNRSGRFHEQARRGEYSDPWKL